MILTTHLLTGAALGAKMENPYLIASSALALHFLLDLFPHGDYLNKKSRLQEFWKVAVDLAIGLFIVFAIIYVRGEISNKGLNIGNIAIGIFFSLLPDGITFLYWKMGIKFLRPIYNFHQKLHRAPEFSPEREFRLKNNLWDLIISVISLVIFFLA